MNKRTALWDHIFSQLDDIQVFYFYRLYIKEIATPFHKPKLIAELKKFTQQHADAMISLLDEEDISFLSFILLFGTADYTAMHEFYKALGLSSFTIQKKLMNLQERMIVFFHDGSLHINPLLLNRLLPYAGLSTLFMRKLKPADPEGKPERRKKVNRHESFWFTLDTCIGLFSLLELKPQSSADPGSIYAASFPDKLPLSGTLQKEAASDFILRMLGRLSLDTYPFTAAQKRHIDLLMQLPEPVCYGLLVLCGVLPENAAADETLLSAFISFTAAVSQLQLKKSELILLFSLMSSDTVLTRGDCELIIERLIELNFLAASDADSKLLTVNSSCAAQLLSGSADTPEAPDEADSPAESSGTSRKSGIESAQPAAILSNDFTLHIPKEIPCSQWYAVYKFAVHQKSDQLASFQITKESVLLAVDRGLDAEHILQYAESLTGKVPESVAVSVKQWEKDFLEIQLFRGTVLKAEGRKKFIIDHHPEIQKYMLRKLADGVYLINQQSEHQLRDILKRSGIDFLPSTQFTENMSENFAVSGSGNEHSLESLLRSLSNLTVGEIRNSALSQLHSAEAEKHGRRTAPLNRNAAEAYYAEYQHEIDEHYSGDEHDELSERLQNRILLSFRQLHSCSHVRTRFGADGFNYQSKIQLIKQAVSHAEELLEIRMRPNEEAAADSASAGPLSVQPDSSADTAILFRPVRVEKGTAENPADTVSGYVLPEGTQAALPISKIFRIVRIRKPLHLPGMDTHSR